jgi:hypothetical protein
MIYAVVKYASHGHKALHLFVLFVHFAIVCILLLHSVLYSYNVQLKNHTNYRHSQPYELTTSYLGDKRGQTLSTVSNEYDGYSLSTGLTGPVGLRYASGYLANNKH